MPMTWIVRPEVTAARVDAASRAAEDRQSSTSPTTMRRVTRESGIDISGCCRPYFQVPSTEEGRSGDVYLLNMVRPPAHPYPRRVLRATAEGLGQEVLRARSSTSTGTRHSTRTSSSCRPDRCRCTARRMWDAMTRAQQIELSRQELVNTLSAGIWFENILNQALLRKMMHQDPTVECHALRADRTRRRDPPHGDVRQGHRAGRRASRCGPGCYQRIDHQLAAVGVSAARCCGSPR